MRISRVLAACAVAAGVGAGASAAFPQEQPYQQCYYELETDPPNSCTTCTGRCFGAGYRCCLVIML